MIALLPASAADNDWMRLRDLQASCSLYRWSLKGMAVTLNYKIKIFQKCIWKQFLPFVKSLSFLFFLHSLKYFKIKKWGERKVHQNSRGWHFNQSKIPWRMDKAAAFVKISGFDLKPAISEGPRLKYITDYIIHNILLKSTEFAGGLQSEPCSCSAWWLVIRFSVRCTQVLCPRDMNKLLLSRLQWLWSCSVNDYKTVSHK